MIIKFKKLHPEATLPKYAKQGDAAMDMTAVSMEVDEATGNLIYDTGLAMEIPEGHVCLLFPRSSVCKTQLSLANSVGVLDSSYRGPCKFVFRQSAHNRVQNEYKVGDRVGQMMVIPHPIMEPILVDELSTTDRGAGGFGSTGK